MANIVDSINSLLSSLYMSKNPAAHFVGNAGFDLACLAFKLKRCPSEEKLNAIIDEFRPGLNAEDKKKLASRLRREWIKYGCAIDENFLYHFDTATNQEKKAFISDVDRLKYSSALNNRASARIFKHKYQSSQVFKEFYKREVVRAVDMTPDFLERHPEFIFKKEDGSRGVSVRLIKAAEYNNDIPTMAAKIDGWKGGICEERIIQDERMAAFHPQSVNTCRIFTLKKKNGDVVVWCGTLRTGGGDSIVDNGFMGGVFAEIDPETGVIFTDGITERGVVHKAHPDTGKVFKGFQIPEWESLRETVTAMAKVLPDIHDVGWDLALSDKGWVMVEGNAQAQIILSQTVTLKPMKQQFMDIMFK